MQIVFLRRRSQPCTVGQTDQLVFDRAARKGVTGDKFFRLGPGCTAVGRTRDHGMPAARSQSFFIKEPEETAERVLIQNRVPMCNVVVRCNADRCCPAVRFADRKPDTDIRIGFVGTAKPCSSKTPIGHADDGGSVTRRCLSRFDGIDRTLFKQFQLHRRTTEQKKIPIS